MCGLAISVQGMYMKYYVQHNIHTGYCTASEKLRKGKNAKGNPNNTSCA